MNKVMENMCHNTNMHSPPPQRTQLNVKYVFPPQCVTRLQYYVFFIRFHSKQDSIQLTGLGMFCSPFIRYSQITIYEEIRTHFLLKQYTSNALTSHGQGFVLSHFKNFNFHERTKVSGLK